MKEVGALDVEPRRRKTSRAMGRAGGMTTILLIIHGHAEGIGTARSGKFQRGAAVKRLGASTRRPIRIKFQRE